MAKREDLNVKKGVQGFVTKAPKPVKAPTPGFPPNPLVADTDSKEKTTTPTEDIHALFSQRRKPSSDESFSTAWEKVQLERDAAGLRRHEVTPRTVTEKYVVEPKRADSTGKVYYVAYVKETGKTKTFDSQWKAESWARASAGDPLIADDMYALKSNIRNVIEAEGYSQPSAIWRGSNPVVIYRDQIDGAQKAFRIYRNADDSSATGESWKVEIEVSSTTGPGYVPKKIWEGGHPPSRDEMIAALK